MRSIYALLLVGIMMTGCKNEQKKESGTAASEENENTEQMVATSEKDSAEIKIDPISHATTVIHFGDKVIYLDPVGGAEGFDGKDKADFVLITHTHPDHMDPETLKGLNLGDTPIIVPQTVKDALPQELQKNLIVMNNGESREQSGLKVHALPMYNLPESKDAYHVKGKGNGYILESNGKKLYIAGDTEDIPEMRNLEDIDVALIPMNLPYTMPVEKAAEGVLAFAPKKVYPYHYRNKDGFSDVEHFKELVNEKNKDIEVVLLNWYPESQNTNE
ncbi:MAG: MBL fold metallo-hydrolase [Salegentibacter sp.]